MKISRLVVVAVVLLSWSLPIMAQDGKALFEKKCAMCHGKDGKKVADVKFTEEGVKKGKPPKMPAQEGKMTPEEIKAVVEYANSLK
ncbi:MAG: cytochrome c [Deltaproteobacteria bacterium]|nr:cytochrome c [Deltaproteobacteria bacterium]MBI4374726.1 cytochrome c [Deltaproteobacteria bacterium]